MIITIKEITDPNDIEVMIEDPEFFPDVRRFYVLCEYDPAVKGDVDNADWPARIYIHEAYIVMDEDYTCYLTVSDVKEHLQWSDFYDVVFDKVEASR